MTSTHHKMLVSQTCASWSPGKLRTEETDAKWSRDDKFLILLLTPHQTFVGESEESKSLLQWDPAQCLIFIVRESEAQRGLPLPRPHCLLELRSHGPRAGLAWCRVRQGPSVEPFPRNTQVAVIRPLGRPQSSLGVSPSSTGAQALG